MLASATPPTIKTAPGPGRIRRGTPATARAPPAAIWTAPLIFCVCDAGISSPSTGITSGITVTGSLVDSAVAVTLLVVVLFRTSDSELLSPGETVDESLFMVLVAS